MKTNTVYVALSVVVASALAVATAAAVVTMAPSTANAYVETLTVSPSVPAASVNAMGTPVSISYFDGINESAIAVAAYD